MNQISYQFSRDISLAQKANELDQLGNRLRKTLCTGTLPSPLANLGLQIRPDGSGLGLTVTAHHLSLHGRLDHVWIDNGAQRRELAGRIRFFFQKPDGSDQEDASYEVIFDSLGNLQLGSNAGFRHAIVSGEDTLEQETFRQLTTALVNVIHASLDTLVPVD